MLLVSTLFAITWAPAQVFYLIVNIHHTFTFHANFFNAILIVAYLYLCTNPFIYATKFDPVKRVLLALVPCKKYYTRNLPTASNSLDRTPHSSATWNSRTW